MDEKFIDAHVYCPDFDKTIQLMREKRPKFGPFLCFRNYVDGLWTGSVLVVVLTDGTDKKANDLLQVWSNSFRYTISPRLLNVMFEYTILRYDLSLDVGNNEHTQIWYESFGKTFSFHVAPSHGEQSLFFYSCNGVSHATGYNGVPQKWGLQPLWQDVMQHHQVKKYNVMIGVGDQIYNDDIWYHVPSLVKWRKIATVKERETAPFTEEMELELRYFIFYNYLRHYSEPFFSDALSHIPSIMLVDDHDLFDGYGSYPPSLQNCPVFLGCGKVLIDMYLLFQHHTTTNLAKTQNQLFGLKGYNFVKYISDNIVVVGVDNRLERTTTQVVLSETWEQVFKEMYAVKSTVKHVLFLSAIPMIYPKMNMAESVLEKISKFQRNKVVQKLFKYTRRMYLKLGYNMFGEPNLLDDFIDRWTSDKHIQERNQLLKKLQDFSKEKRIRVTFLAGDVHCCSIGKFSTPSTERLKKVRKIENNSLLSAAVSHDSKFMLQITSSAIANVPPPRNIMRLFHVLDKPEIINNDTDARIIPFFYQTSIFSNKKLSEKKILCRRNWCEISGPLTEGLDDSLLFTLRVERMKGSGVTLPHTILAPKLMME